MADRSLEERCETQRRELANLYDVLHRKNLELDALHMVWCDGGCVNGVHRWTDEPITEEIVALAERNTKRLRHWFDVVQFRLKHAPMQSEWQQERAERLREKTERETTTSPQPKAGSVSAMDQTTPDNFALVVSAVRDSLPEFARRNRIRLSDEVMDNLACWVAGVVPSGMWREFCGAGLAGIPCACSGTCLVWHTIEPPHE